MVFQDGVSGIRTSKSGWLSDEEHKVIRDISVRVEDMSGLSIKTAEKLQVVNYGIGGHYLSHYDFFTERDEDLMAEIGTGNRIGTLMIYVSTLCNCRMFRLIMMMILGWVDDDIRSVGRLDGHLEPNPSCLFVNHLVFENR